MECEFIIEDKTGLVVVSLKGNLIENERSSVLLSSIDELISKEQTNLILDLKHLNYINSIGLGVLISILTKARNAGGEAIIANVSEKINNLLVITKLNTVFTVADSQEEAIAELSEL